MKVKNSPLGLVIFYLGLIIAAAGVNQAAHAQQPPKWTTPQQIPNLDDETVRLVLVPDQNRTVHMFTSQWIGEDEGRPQRVIMYSQWSLEGDWTELNDIILPPIKQEARVLDAFLDSSGMIHLTFFAGDEVEANTYYTKAPAYLARQATAWSMPIIVGERPLVPEDGIIAGDDKGNLFILYSGNLIGHGIYATYSADSGESWSDPSPIFLTNDDTLWPFGLDVCEDQSGQLHAVWNTDDISGQGRGIYYAMLQFGTTEWSDPLRLAAVESGLGTKAPTIIKYGGDLFVAYYIGTNGKINFVLSHDGGKTWSDPVTPFPHVGYNGTNSFVVDSNQDLHFLWGQRISGSPDIHGMWHSIWEEGSWSAYEPVVSGPQIVDKSNGNGFDPAHAIGVTSQGNVVLVTWQTDAFAGENGIWYSSLQLDSLEFPVVELPRPMNEVAITPVAADLVTRPAPTTTLSSRQIVSAVETKPMASNSNVLLIAILPSLVLVLVLIFYRSLKNR
jgi:hypothetical protein